MILKKPYALFIKIFKPIHIFMASLIIYLIYKTNKILIFLNEYIYSSDNVVGQTIKENLVSSILYIIPILLIIFSLIFFGIMFNKRKPFTFYIVNIFALLVIIIINLYTSNFLGMMEKSILSIKIVKFNHDLILINMIIEIVIFIFLVIRGLGINFKKFNFDSDITKLNISDSDSEEFELNVNVDIDEAKRRRRKKIRYFKYFYKENSFLINSVVISIVCIVLIISIFIILNSKKNNVEGIVYNMNKFNFKINKTILINENFSGKKVTDNYLIVVDVDLNSNLKSVSLFLKDFSLDIGEAVFKTQTKYSDEILDLGTTYDETILGQEFKNYLFVFEVPEKYIKSDMFFTYNNEGVKTEVKLNPQNLVDNKVETIKKIKEEINFNDTIGKISFKINNFDIKDKFLIEYNYCISQNDCIPSKEYIKPTINENFDKNVLKLDVSYSNKSNIDANSFYKFFSKFGTIQYKINNTWYSQNSKFEQLKSNKVNNKNNVYIGINSNIINSSSIKLVFNIRNSKYEYILK